MKAWIVCLISGVFILGSTALRSAEIKASEESISGRSYAAIQAAVAEFEGHASNIERYRIIVEEMQNSWIVLFIDADVTDEERRRVRGSPGKLAAFAVELKRDNLQVISSHFVR